MHYSVQEATLTSQNKVNNILFTFYRIIKNQFMLVWNN